MPVNLNGGQAPQQSAQQQASAPQGKAPGFLKTGEQAQEGFKQQEQARQAAQEAFGRMWRFYIDKKDLGKPHKVTFLDGIVHPTTKLLGNPSWKDHSVKNARGFYDNYVCTDHGGPGAEPCPICGNASADKPAFVMGFTILDHRPVTFTKGDKAGQTVPYTRKLLVAKSKTLPLLQVKAAKLGGLRGVMMDIVRTSTTEAAVGNIFELDEQWGEDELQAKYGKDALPADWDFELNYKTGQQLIDMGVALPVAGITQGAPSDDYTKQY